MSEQDELVPRHALQMGVPFMEPLGTQSLPRVVPKANDEGVGDDDASTLELQEVIENGRPRSNVLDGTYRYRGCTIQFVDPNIILETRKQSLSRKLTYRLECTYVRLVSESGSEPALDARADKHVSLEVTSARTQWE